MWAVIAKKLMGFCGGCGSVIEPGEWVVSRSNGTLHYECVCRAGALQAGQRPPATAAPLLFDDAPRQAVESFKRTIGATVIRFEGPICSVADSGRLRGQILRVFHLMKDGDWRTLDEIAQATGDPHASISAQLRHLRKARFGAHEVNRRARGDRDRGLFEYQLLVNRACASGSEAA